MVAWPPVRAMFAEAMGWSNVSTIESVFPPRHSMPLPVPESGRAMSYAVPP